MRNSPEVGFRGRKVEATTTDVFPTMNKFLDYHYDLARSDHLLYFWLGLFHAAPCIGITLEGFSIVISLAICSLWTGRTWL